MKKLLIKLGKALIKLADEPKQQEDAASEPVAPAESEELIKAKADAELAQIEVLNAQAKYMREINNLLIYNGKPQEVTHEQQSK